MRNLLTAAIAVVLTFGCTSAEPNECNDSCDMEGTISCAGDGFRVCQQTDTCLAWSAITTCGSSQYCEAGVCNPKSDECENECQPSSKQCIDAKTATCELGIDGCYHLSDPVECPSGQSCSGGRCRNTGAISANAALTGNFVSRNGAKILPTFLSHILGGEKYPLIEVTINNTTGDPVDLKLTASLPNYASTTSRTITAKPGISKVAMSPALDHVKLFQVTTPLSATMQVTVETKQGEELLAQTIPISIASRNTAFWTLDGKPVYPLVSAMVTPHDKDGLVDELLVEAANLLPSRSLAGYQNQQVPSESFSLSSDTYDYETVYMKPGWTVTVQISSLQGAQDVDLYILDDANFAAWANGQQAQGCAIAAGAQTAATATCQATNAGEYHVVYYNQHASAVTVARNRSATKFENVLLQSAAIYQAIKNRGLTYVNVPGDFFEGSQHVRYPAESLKSNGANCIDGSLLFAAAWESLGMRPVVVIVPGHAFAGVRLWNDDDDVIAIETTMLGSYSFKDAFTTGMNSYSSHQTQGTIVSLIDVPNMRNAGILPAPM